MGAKTGSEGVQGIHPPPLKTHLQIYIGCFPMISCLTQLMSQKCLEPVSYCKKHPVIIEKRFSNLMGEQEAKASWLTPALELTVQGLNPACTLACDGSRNSSAYDGQQSLYLGDADDCVFSGRP